MKATAKAVKPNTLPVPIRKPEGRPKVKQGTGSNLGYISDTLFDDDLKR